MRWTHNIMLCGLALIAGCTDSKQPFISHYSAEIIRDDYGIPHIYGKTDADAVYGMIYAQAERYFLICGRVYI